MVFTQLTWAQSQNQGNLNTLTQTGDADAKSNANSQHSVRKLSQKNQNIVHFPMLDEMSTFATGHFWRAAPDERYLWAMLQQGKMSLLQTEIRRLHRTDPSWSPSAALSRSIRQLTRKQPVNMGSNGRMHLKLAYFLAENPNDPGVIYGKQVKVYQNSKLMIPSAALVQMVEGRKDAGVAKLFAWNAFHARQFDSAIHWFNQSLAWLPADSDARYGLALAYYNHGDTNKALAQLIHLDTPEAIKLHGDIIYAQGLNSYAAGEYQQADSLFANAAKLGRNSRDLSLMQAWAVYRLGDFKLALERFAALYQIKPDENAAQGLYLSAKTSHQTTKLASWMGADSADPLRRIVLTERSDFLKQQGWVLAARAMNPSGTPELAGIEGPWTETDVAERTRSGASGESYLQTRLTTLTTGVAHGSDVYQLRLTQVMLSTGALTTNSLYGNYVSGRSWGTVPTTSFIGWEPTGKWRHEVDGLATQISVGLTPLGSVVPPTPTAKFVFEGVGVGNTWSTSAYRDSVRDSLLSMVGAIDPFTGLAWGRVVRNGVGVDGFQSIDKQWSINGNAHAENLTGDHVESNSHIAASVGLGYALALPYFTYFSVGPSIAYDQYAKNLSQFTWGNGGYFSPQNFLNVGGSASFLTQEGTRSIARGQLNLGWQTLQQDGSPCFPISATIAAASCGNYASSNQSGIGGSLEGMWNYAVTPNWQLGGAVEVRHSQGYSDTSLMLTLRYVWQKHMALYRTDLPESQLNELY